MQYMHTVIAKLISTIWLTKKLYTTLNIWFSVAYTIHYCLGIVGCSLYVSQISSDVNFQSKVACNILKNNNECLLTYTFYS